MPASLPFWLILWGIIKVVIRTVVTIFKITWLTFWWAIAMPFASAWLLFVYKGSFINLFTPNWLLTGAAVMTGWAMTGGMIISFLSLLLLRDYMASHGLLRLRIRRRPMPLEEENELVSISETLPLPMAMDATPARAPIDEAEYIDEAILSEGLVAPSEAATVLSHPFSATSVISERSSSRSAWLNDVSPRDYRAYLRRRELHKERLEISRSQITSVNMAVSPLEENNLGKESILKRYNTIDDTTNNTTTLGPTSPLFEHSSHHIHTQASTSTRNEFDNSTTAFGRRNFKSELPAIGRERHFPTNSSIKVTFKDDYRCKICKSSTCIKKEHVIMASSNNSTSKGGVANTFIEEATVKEVDLQAENINSIPPPRPDPQNSIPPPVIPPINGNEPAEEENEDRGAWNILGVDNDGQALTFKEFIGIDGGLLAPIQSAITVVIFNWIFLFGFIVLPKSTGASIWRSVGPTIEWISVRWEAALACLRIFDSGPIRVVFWGLRWLWQTMVSIMPKITAFSSLFDIKGWTWPIQKLLLQQLEFIKQHGCLFAIEPGSAVSYFLQVLLGQMLLVGLGQCYTKFCISWRRSSLSILEKSFIRGCLIVNGLFRLLMVIFLELVLFPIYCGWIIDYCFAALIQYDRLEFFMEYSKTSHFLHWTVGLISLLLITIQLGWLRKVFRPGLLYFIRNAEDPDHLPLKEAVERPLLRHAFRVLLSSMLYGIFLGWFCGGFSLICKLLMPKVIPFNFNHRDSLREIPYDILGQIFAKAVFGIVEPTQIGAGIKSYLRIVCRLLKIQSYFYGGRYRPEEVSTKGQFVYVPDQNRRYKPERIAKMAKKLVDPVDLAKVPVAEDFFEPQELATPRYQPLPVDPIRPGTRNLPRHHHEAKGFTVVYRPNGLPGRILAFLGSLWFMTQVLALIWIIAPILLGRLIYKSILPTDRTVMDIHAFYIGFLALSLIVKVAHVSIDFLIRNGVRRYVIQLARFPLFLSKAIVVLTAFLVLWPLLFGFYCMVLLTPLIVALDETFIFPPFMCWFTGLILVHTIWTAREALFAERRLEILRRLSTLAGWWDMNFWEVFVKVLAPYTGRIVTLIVAPPLTILVMAPLFNLSEAQLLMLQRWSHLISLAIPATVLIIWLGMQLRGRLARRIRDENFLIGERLLNFNVQ